MRVHLIPHILVTQYLAGRCVFQAAFDVLCEIPADLQRLKKSLVLGRGKKHGNRTPGTCDGPLFTEFLFLGKQLCKLGVCLQKRYGRHHESLQAGL